MAISKLRIKLGDVEVEYEGEAAFVETGLIELVGKVQDMAAKSTPVMARSAMNAGKPGATPASSPSTPVQMTTKSIATKMSAKKGPEVAKAAVAKLGILQGKPTFSRSEILEEMRTATGIFRPSMNGNMTPILNSLAQDDVIIESSPEVYALTPNGETQLRQQLAI
ncbi:MAG TPA: hypothetical protein VJO12_14880 [Stellaceae bacterium]|nr:hypothetical protein [Stellaceae bacterium]